jgi:hypothetical protein
MLREAMGLQLNPDRVSFSVLNDVTAAEAAKAASRAATPTKMVTAHGMPNRRVSALQLLFFMFLCMYMTILDFGYVNFLTRGTGSCARSGIPGIAAVPHLTAGVRGSLPSQRVAAGDEKVSREVSIASFTALARRSLNIEILRDPVKGKCICSIPRRAEFTFTCSDHFQQLLDADTKKLFWPEVFGHPTAASLLLALVIPNVHQIC